MCAALMPCTIPRDGVSTPVAAGGRFLAVVDQAIGVVVAVHRIPPAVGFEMLREVAQHTDIKLHTVAE